jgi:hypothetical protein
MAPDRKDQELLIRVPRRALEKGEITLRLLLVDEIESPQAELCESHQSD